MGKKVTISFTLLEYIIIIWLISLLLLPEIFMVNHLLILIMGIVIGIYNIGLTIILPFMIIALGAVYIFVYTNKIKHKFNDTIKTVRSSTDIKHTFYKQAIDIILRFVIIYLAWRFNYKYLSIISIISLIITLGFKAISTDFKVKIAKLTLLDNAEDVV